MPGRNGTGPNGMGSMTGRGAGPCGGTAGQGWPNRAAGGGFGMGFGRGGGRGRGRGWCQDWTGGPWGGQRWGGYGAVYGYPVPYGQPDPNLEKQALADQAKALQAQLNSIQNRLAEIESDPAED